jgi:hypothetical protein
VFKRIAEQALAYLGVPHDVPSPSDVETAQNSHGPARANAHQTDDLDLGRQRFADAVAKASRPAASAPTVAFGDQNVAVPSLAGQSVRGVTEACSKLGLTPTLIGTGVAVEQFPEPGAEVLRGSRVTVRFGRPGELVAVSARRGGN